jgi:hypothetical protein
MCRHCHVFASNPGGFGDSWVAFGNLLKAFAAEAASLSAASDRELYPSLIVHVDLVVRRDAYNNSVWNKTYFDMA